MPRHVAQCAASLLTRPARFQPSRPLSCDADLDRRRASKRISPQPCDVDRGVSVASMAWSPRSLQNESRRWRGARLLRAAGHDARFRVKRWRAQFSAGEKSQGTAVIRQAESPEATPGEGNGYNIKTATVRFSAVINLRNRNQTRPNASRPSREIQRLRYAQKWSAVGRASHYRPATPQQNSLGLCAPAPLTVRGTAAPLAPRPRGRTRPRRPVARPAPRPPLRGLSRRWRISRRWRAGGVEVRSGASRRWRIGDVKFEDSTRRSRRWRAGGVEVCLRRP